MLLAPLVLDVPHARAALRVEVARAAPGTPFLAAVEVDTDPHWHVYWRNPGDSGIPTQIVWHAPKGWRVEPLEYPAPRRFAPGGVAAYGYEGPTLFLARVTPTASPGTLSASVKWLVCSNACIAGAATPASRIAVGPREMAGAQAERLRQAAERLPRPVSDWFVHATKGKAGVTLTLRPPRTLSVGSTAEFFPLESGLIDQAKPATATFRGGAFVFQMSASPFPESRTSLKGLLVFSGNRDKALTVATKLESGS